VWRGRRAAGWWRLGWRVLAGIGWATAVLAAPGHQGRHRPGVAHYSNVPAGTPSGVSMYDTDDGVARPSDDAAPAAAVGEPGGEAEAGGDGAPPSVAVADVPAGAAAAPEDAAFSTSASLQRRQLERQIHDAQQRIGDIDREMQTHAAARTRSSEHGSAAVGGLRAQAKDVLSPEEERLAKEKAQLEAEVSETRKQYAALRAEVTGRLGRTPDWWVELR